MPRLQLRLTPHGHLLLANTDEAPVIDGKLAGRLADAFERGSGHGLLRLGAGEVGQPLPPTFAWWRDVAARYVGAVCLHAPGVASEARADIPPPTESELGTLVLTAPMMPGAEYLNADVLLGLWTDEPIGTSLFASPGRFLSRHCDRTYASSPTWRPSDDGSQCRLRESRH
jgi:non-specific serine/threonine protein kinase